jgi:hypothetical protein
MTTPNDPGRPEDRPSDQPGYPPAPPPEQYPQGQPPQEGGYAGGPGGGQFPPAPDYGTAPQPGAASPYSSAPQYSDPYGGQPAPAGPPPKEVIWASMLMFIQAALGLLSLLLTFADSDGYKDTIRENSPELTADEVNTAYTLSLVFALIIGLVFSALYVLLALQLRKGKNWARITTFVIAGVSLLFGLLGLAADVPSLSRLIGIVGLLLNLGIIVLLLLKPSKDYFAARKAARQ